MKTLRRRPSQENVGVVSDEFSKLKLNLIGQHR